MVWHNLRTTLALLCVLRLPHSIAGQQQQQRSALFSAVQLAGRTQCLADPPLVTLTVRSRIECSSRCDGFADGGCVAFNFRQGVSACDLFIKVSGNYTETNGCALYQVGRGALSRRGRLTRI